jgi:hypothetical protein
MQAHDPAGPDHPAVGQPFDELTYEQPRERVLAQRPADRSMTLTGAGGLTIFSQTLGGAAAAVALCIAI